MFKKKNSFYKNKQGAFDMIYSELIAFAMAIGFLLFIFMSLSKWSNPKNFPDEVIQKQLKELAKDIEALSNGQSLNVPFDVNMDKAEYKLITKRGCIKKETLDKDKCLKNAKLCIVDIAGMKNPFCEEIDNGNFIENDDNVLIQQGARSISIKKDLEGMIVFA